MSLKRTLTSSKLGHFLAQNTSLMNGVADELVPAVGAEEAVDVAKYLEKEGFFVCLHHLGVVSTHADDIKENVKQILDVMELLDEEKLNLCVSLVPSELGFLRSSKTGENCFKQIARNFRSRTQAYAVEHRHGVTDKNLTGAQKHHLMLHASSKVPVQKVQALNAAYDRSDVDSVMTIPAALFRSIDDVKILISQGAKARLSLVPNMIMDTRYFMTQEDIQKNYIKLAKLLLSEDALIQQTYSVFSLEDEDMANEIKIMANEGGWQKGDFEFEIAYGVNDELAHRLREEGYSVRILLPFGREWWPYYVKMTQAQSE